MVLGAQGEAPLFNLFELQGEQTQNKPQSNNYIYFSQKEQKESTDTSVPNNFNSAMMLFSY